ncbi:MAG: ribonuclease III [Parcubacteria group bacterium]|nr:ribonuclease III [Parcubacteria group bacterium]
MPKPRQNSHRAQLDAVEAIIGVRFRNRALLREALTHRSYLNETTEEGLDHNERLEFLGDAVLEYVIRSHLYRSKPPLQEGEMTALRNALASNKTLATLGDELKLGQHMFLARGQRRDFESGDRSCTFITGGMIEAVIGAISVDRGIGTAELFVLEFILPRLREIVETKSHIDPKTHFQELSHERFGMTPHYEVLLEQGPDHDKVYVVAAHLGDKRLATGRGSSTQQAETDAARKALIEQFNVTLPE